MNRCEIRGGQFPFREHPGSQTQSHMLPLNWALDLRHVFLVRELESINLLVFASHSFFSAQPTHILHISSQPCPQKQQHQSSRSKDHCHLSKCTGRRNDSNHQHEGSDTDLMHTTTGATARIKITTNQDYQRETHTSRECQVKRRRQRERDRTTLD